MSCSLFLEGKTRLRAEESVLSLALFVPDSDVCTCSVCGSESSAAEDQSRLGYYAVWIGKYLRLGGL